MDFNNKVVFLTGAASGLGQKTAITFAKINANLSLIDINENNLKKTVEMCKNVSDSQVFALTADLGKVEEVKRVVDATIEEFGKIDVVVNCAGIYGPGRILDASLMATYDKVMAINLRSAVAVTHYAAPALVESKGCIVNVVSNAPLLHITDIIPYNLSKSALRHFSKCVALELAAKEVRVNSISPGSMKTNILQRAGIHENSSDAVWNSVAKNNPLKELVDTGDVADMIVFLSSDKGKGVTGSDFVMDAGLALSGYQVKTAKEVLSK